MNRVLRTPVSRETQEYIAQAEPQKAPCELRHWRWQVHWRSTAQDGGYLCQSTLNGVRAGESGQRECLSGPCHGNVVQSSRGVLVLALANAVPASVQHHDMVELQSLGAMGGQQQKATLAATRFPAPFGQPFNEMVYWHLRATGLYRVVRHGLLQEFGPRV